MQTIFIVFLLGGSADRPPRVAGLSPLLDSARGNSPERLRKGSIPYSASLVEVVIGFGNLGSSIRHLAVLMKENTCFTWMQVVPLTPKLALG